MNKTRRVTEEWVDGPKTFTVVDCKCGQEVPCYSTWANTCDGCGLEYNMGGQSLAPRERWGEETGETDLDFYML
tara:strand:- start:678 stop:899 length:222 start_codon:yes stop_codon:yes gene_type:complete